MNRKTLLAGGIFVGLALLAFSVLKSPEKGTRTGEAPRPVPPIGAGEVDTLEITKAGSTTTVKKEGTTYKVTAPTPYPADQDAARQAFEAIEKLEFGSIVSDQKTQQDEFEVGANGLRVVAKKAGKTLADLRVGKVTNSATMVRPEGKDDIWQAMGSLKSPFDRDSNGWRDKSLTTFNEGDVEKLEVVSKGGGKIVLTKSAKKEGGAADDGWRVVESSTKVDPIDRAVAPGIVSALYAWKTNDFADNAKPEETGLNDPALTITVTLKGDKHVTVLIGNKKGEEDFYVKTADSPQVFLVKKYNLERVNKRPIDFRDKTFCNLNEGEIAEVAVTRDKDSFTLSKGGAAASVPGKGSGKGADKEAGKGAVWKLAKPTGITLDPAKVTPITTSFHEWKGTTFAEDNSPKATGLGKPTATIAARSGVKGNGCTLKIGSETADKQSYYVQKAGSGDVLVVPKWSVDRVLVKLDDLKKK